MAVGLDELVAALRNDGGDFAAVEVKSARGGLPTTLAESMSALANLPGGGTIILGLDEAAGFAPVSMSNIHALKQGLASKARSLTPPPRLEISDGDVDGAPVIVARVAECPVSDKPCRITATRRAYMRGHDGDYQLSELEEQGFLRAREAPHADRAAVPGSGVSDLDPDLLDVWLAHARSRPGLSRFVGDELLKRAGVVTAHGELTKAALLTLGAYPQQFYPQLNVRVADVRSADPTTRARNATTLDGPVPRMLTATMNWLRVNLASTVRAGADGSVRDVPEYPLEALRELVANALVHRDLDAWSEGMAIELRLYRDRLVLANPGGLYGITVDRLGAEHVTSARNARLVDLCTNARDPSDDTRVIEALASGLPRVAAALHAASLPAARYVDTGLRFTVVLRNAGQRPVSAAPVTTELGDQGPKSGSQIATVLAALRTGGSQTVEELARATGAAPPSVRRALTRLRLEYRLVEVEAGGPGRHTTYAATPHGDV